MKEKYLLCILIAFITLPLNSLAQQTDVLNPDRKINSFSGKTEIGFSKTSGNIEKENLLYGAMVNFKKIKTELSLDASGMISSLGGKKFEEHHKASILNVYSVGESAGIFGKATYLTNKSRGINNLWIFDLGYLLHLVPNMEKNFLDTRLGIQFRLPDYTDNSYENLKLITLGLRGGLNIARNINFIDDFNYSVNFENTNVYFITNKASLVFTVNNNINLSFDHEIDYSSRPKPEEIKKTDQLLATRLIFNY